MQKTGMRSKVALLAGATAVVGMATITACGSDTTEKPADTQAPTVITTADALQILKLSTGLRLDWKPTDLPPVAPSWPQT